MTIPINQTAFERLLAAPSETAPAQLSVGSSVQLIEVGDAIRFFPGHRRQDLFRILRTLGICFIYDKKKAYFNLYALEKVLHYLTRPNGTSFALPGSDYKRRYKYDPSMVPAEPIAYEMTPADQAAIDSPAMVRDRLATGTVSSHSIKRILDSMSNPRNPKPFLQEAKL